MTEQEIITHGGTDRGYKMCRCNKCMIEKKCTPFFDFYTLDKDGDAGPLYCEICMRQQVSEEFHKENNNNAKSIS